MKLSLLHSLQFRNKEVLGNKHIVTFQVHFVTLLSSSFILEVSVLSVHIILFNYDNVIFIKINYTKLYFTKCISWPSFDG